MTENNHNQAEEFKSVSQTIINNMNDNKSPEIDLDTLEAEVSKDESNDSKPSVLDEDKDLSELPLPEESKSNEDDFPDWMKDRIRKKNKKIAEKEAELVEIKNKLNELSKTQIPQNILSDSLPTRDNFETEEEFIQANVDFHINKRAHEFERQAQHQAILEAEKKHYEKVNDVISKGEAKYHDFSDITEELFSSSFPPNPVLAHEVFSSEFAEDIVYFFGKYPEKAREIAKKTPNEVIKKIYDIENRFREAKKSKAKKSNFQPSDNMRGKAVGSLNSTYENLANMSQKDFEKAWEEKHGKKNIW